MSNKHDLALTASVPTTHINESKFTKKQKHNTVQIIIQQQFLKRQHSITFGVLIIIKIVMQLLYCRELVHYESNYSLTTEQKSLAYYIQGSLRCHATRCCHGTSSSLRTAGMAGGCVGNIQRATRQCPTPALQRAGKGRV